MLDYDLSEMYGVETRVLKQAVRRNKRRFPADFMIELTIIEHDALKKQFGARRRGRHSKYPSFAFTEQGVSMLSSVLNSETAIQVNIQIIRIFARLREMLATHNDIVDRLYRVEYKLTEHNDKIVLIFEYLKQFKERKRIGYNSPEKSLILLHRTDPTRFNNIRRDALDHRGDTVSFIEMILWDFLNHITDNANLICFFSCDMFVANCTSHNALFSHQRLFIFFPDLLCLSQCIHKPGLNHQVCLKQIQVMVDMICNGYIFGLAPCK